MIERTIGKHNEHGEVWKMSVFDVARYILDRQGEMSTWKLQKLCYYAQAWTLAWDGKPLFDEDFEAWANGPVCRPLYDEHRGAFIVRPEMIQGNPKELTADQIENINIVLDSYGDKDAYWLREQSHAEDPWKDARGDLPEGERGNSIISKDSMGLYYGSL